MGSQGVNFTNSYSDPYNYSVYLTGYGYYSLFGNSSLEIDAANTNNVSLALSNAFNVNCAPGGFENLSMTVKHVQPSSVPQSANLTLYSVNDTNYYTYDLTPSLSNASAINLWQNLTIPVGPSAQGWTR